MQWFYVENEEQAGPVDEAEFAKLQSLGTIRERTLVYRQGMSDWMALSEARAQGFWSPPPATSKTNAGTDAGTGAADVRVNPLASAGLKPTLAETDGLIACPNCGARVRDNELIPMGDRFVCVHCRDVTLQKIREGVDPNGLAIRYAGFGHRFLGSFIDGIIMQIYSVILNTSFGLGMTDSAGAMLETPIMILYFVFSIGVPLAYVVYFLGNRRFQATPGMMAVKIRLIRPDGTPMSYWRAFGRYLASIISSLLLGIGYLMMLWDPENRTLHYRMVDTRVVHR